MEPKQNYSYLIDDNARLQQENWKYKKAGCSNENHISFVLQLEEKDKLIENTKNELQIQIQQANSTIDDLKRENEELKNQIESITKDQNKLKLIEFLVFPSKIIELKSFSLLSNWIDKTKNIKFKLIYRASENNFATNSFHSHCDDKGPTVTIIETTDGCIFGGYNSHSWASVDEEGDSFCGGDDKCFIFTLVNKHGIEPTKYEAKEDYVFNSPVFGPYFGTRDIDLRGGGFGYQNFPYNYVDTTGHGKTTLTPAEKFNIKEYEVYQCT